MAFKKYVLSFWFFAVALVLCSGLITIFLYRFNVGVEFSKNPNDWSGFGSYVGGVLGPLVSFVTLLAVLRTVYLQKELLQIQRSEFKSVIRLQAKTYASQQRQVKNAIAIAEREHMERARAACLQMLDRQLLHTENKLTRAGNTFETARKLRTGNPQEVTDLCESIKKNIVALMQLAEDFQVISIKISNDPYDSSETLHAFFRDEMGKAYAANAIEA